MPERRLEKIFEHIECDWSDYDTLKVSSYFTADSADCRELLRTQCPSI
jgi:hypothetical protein